MTITKIFIANRGEVAIRIARAIADLGLRSVAAYSQDDAGSLHWRRADEACALPGQRAAAYLDADALIAAALASGCDAVHPGYGFLSERDDFARQCADAGLVFIGPQVEQLALFGDKARARAAALAAGVPVLRGLDHAVTLEQARAFFDSLGPGAAMIIKAIAGGGGRGTRAVQSAEEIEPAFARCQSEALSSFGRADVFVEQFITRARHVEVQILGDRQGSVTHLGERECSLQRRFQKIVEIAPAPCLDDALRQQIIGAALRFARSVGYRSLGTFEFLVDVSGQPGAQPFVFIEANARLQVEHTVTEQVTGVDLVQTQIRLAQGATLAELGLDAPGIATPRGHAVQARVNMESIGPDGSVRPGGGTLTVYETPSGPGLRTDGFGYAGYVTSSAFDSLLAKVIASSPSTDVADALSRAGRALAEFRIEGVVTNLGFLRNILAHPDVAAGRVHTRWVDEQMVALAAPVADASPLPAVPGSLPGSPADTGHAGARVKSRDPLALFAHDAQVKAQHVQAQQAAPAADLAQPDGSFGLASPIQGTLVAVHVAVGDAVRLGQPATWCEKALRSSMSSRPRLRVAALPSPPRSTWTTSAPTCSR